MKEIGRNPIEKNGHKKIRAGGIENQGFFFIMALQILQSSYKIFRISSCR